MKLLIAEDEAIIRMDLKETLQDLGYEVVAEARSGREAVQKAFAFAPDCALMDAHMDGDDGFAAAQEIGASAVMSRRDGYRLCAGRQGQGSIENGRVWLCNETFR